MIKPNALDERNVSRLQCCGTRCRRAFRIGERSPCDVVDVRRCLVQFSRRVASVDQWKHRCAITIAGAVLVVLRVRQTKRVTKLVYRNTLEIYRARNCVGLCIVDREAKSVADFGVELNVVVENRSGFVEACGKLMSPSLSTSPMTVIADETSESPSPSMSVPLSSVTSVNEVSGWR